MGYTPVRPPPLDRVIAWAVWYEDGSCYRSDEFAAADVPEAKVQAIVYYQLGDDGKVRRFVHCGILDHEAYWFYGRVLLGSYLGTLENPEPYAALKQKIHKDSWLPVIT